ncbi:uncharacterized protein LOC123927631 [Meles meles]|uniref:uncharacterized protein LOC123927631 n=1 Tax=Meles meles TaxID=9662 RepID=UPI001E69D47E|nr:uncharacterized protein LOC123927631 [Meles meles]
MHVMEDEEHRSRQHKIPTALSNRGDFRTGLLHIEAKCIQSALAFDPLRTFSPIPNSQRRPLSPAFLSCLCGGCDFTGELSLCGQGCGFPEASWSRFPPCTEHAGEADGRRGTILLSFSPPGAAAGASEAASTRVFPVMSGAGGKTQARNASPESEDGDSGIFRPYQWHLNRLSHLERGQRGKQSESDAGLAEEMEDTRHGDSSQTDWRESGKVWRMDTDAGEGVSDCELLEIRDCVSHPSSESTELCTEGDAGSVAVSPPERFPLSTGRALCSGSPT